jgi:hypothetical protein
MYIASQKIRKTATGTNPNFSTFHSLLPFWAFNAVTEATDRSSALHAPPPHGLLQSFLLLGFVVWILRKLLFFWGLRIKPVDDA